MSAVRPADVPFGTVPSMLELEAATAVFQRNRVKRLIRTVAGDLDSKLDVQVHVVHGHPAETLIAASQTADLLIVGTRGAGGFRRLLLGSVAGECVRHAACSVMVVRAKHSVPASPQ